jgi:hypothetical protein
MNLTPFVESLHRPEVQLGLRLAFIVFVLSHIPVLGWPLYPFSLFVVYVHELWHGFAGIITGGVFKRFVIEPHPSGEALVDGGVDWIVGSAGYVGTALTGGILLVLASSSVPTRLVLFVIGLLLGILCLLFVRNLFGIVAGFALALAFIVASQRLHDFWLQTALWFLAVQLFLDTLTHLAMLWNYASVPGQRSDAHSLGKLTGISPEIWLVVWILLAVIILLFALNRAYQIPLPWSA